MATISASHYAGYQAGKAVDAAAHDKLAEGLKRNYRKIYDALGSVEDLNLVAPPADPASAPAFDQFIHSLADELIENKTSRAQSIRNALDEDQKEQLSHLKTIRNAAAKSVQENTGDIGFLGGSTLWNAIAGLFTWIFSGFKGGFAGLKQTIAERAVNTTVQDFNNHLREGGIDTQKGFGKDTLEAFQAQAKMKAGLAPKTEKPSLDLSAVAIENNAPPSPAAPAPDLTQAPDQALRTHFEGVADTIHTQLTSLIAGQGLSPEKQTQFTRLLAEAKTSFVEQALIIANPPENALNADFKEQLIAATLKQAKGKLDATADKDMIATIDNLVTELEQPGATVAKVIGKSLSQGNMVSVGILSTFNNALENSRGNLNAIVQNADPAASAKIAEQEQASRRRQEQEKDILRKSFSSVIERKLQDNIDPTAIVQSIDQAIADQLESRYSHKAEKHAESVVKIPFVGERSIPFSNHAKAWTNWAFVRDNRLTRTFSGGEIPSPDDRQKIADYISGAIKPVIKEKLEEILSANGAQRAEYIKDQKLDVKKFTEAAMKEFEKRFDADSQKPGSAIPQFWTKPDKKTLLLESIRRELETKLAPSAEEIGKGIEQLASTGNALPGMKIEGLTNRLPTVEVDKHGRPMHTPTVTNPQQQLQAPAIS